MKSLAVSLIFLATAAVTLAQDAPKAEIFGGYQYLSLDTRGGFRSRQAFNGWNIDGAYRLWRNMALVADFGCGYKQVTADVNGTPQTANGRIYPLLFGPRFSMERKKVTLFGEGLVGFAHESESVDGLGSISENRFAMGGGGGFDVALSRQFTLRLAKADYILIRSGANLNNLRVATGLAFKF